MAISRQPLAPSASPDVTTFQAPSTQVLRERVTPSRGTALPVRASKSSDVLSSSQKEAVAKSRGRWSPSLEFQSQKWNAPCTCSRGGSARGGACSCWSARALMHERLCGWTRRRMGRGLPLGDFCHCLPLQNRTLDPLEEGCETSLLRCEKHHDISSEQRVWTGQE